MKVEVDVSNSPYDVFGRKATWTLNSLSSHSSGSCVKVEVDVSNSPQSLCGRKATPNEQLFVLTVQGSLLVIAGEDRTLAKGLNGVSD